MSMKIRTSGVVLLLLATMSLRAISDTTNSKKRWIGLSSALTVSAQYYHNWGGAPRQQPFMYSISGAPTLDVKGMSMPFSVIYSNQVFNYQQPFNQLGLAPRFKFGSIYLGTSSVKFSNYTLAGQRFTGIGADLQLKWFRLGGMYGRLRRQVFPLNNFNDPLTFLNESANESFLRNGYTAKIGFGTKENFVDLIYFKGYDIKPNNYNAADWIVKPQENVVFGINSSFKIAPKLILKNDWGISAFTRNQDGDTIEITEPQLRKLARSILLPNLTTNLRLAGESSLRWMNKKISPSISYKRIEHEYTSLGAYFFQTDLQQISLGLNMNLFKNRLSANLNAGRQNDNLQKLRLRTSYRNIGSINLNFNPSTKWGMSLMYSNFGITQSPLPKSLTDTTRINQVNHALSFSPRLNIQKKSAQHGLQMVISYNALNNLGASLGASAENTSYTGSLNYNFQHVPSSFSAGISPSIISTRTQPGIFEARGSAVNVGKALLKGKMVFNYALGYFNNTFNGSANGYTLTNLFVVSGNFPKWPTFSLTAQHIQNTSSVATISPSFSELFASITVTYNF